MMLDLIFAVYSEFAFTLYDSVYDTYNLLGHIFQIGSYASIYRGFVVTSIRQPYAELSKAYTELKERERLTLLGQLSSRVIHEVKNFLTVIKANAQIGSMASDVDRAKELFKRIERSGDELNQLTSEFNMVNGSLGSSKPMEPVDLNKLLGGVLPLWRLQLRDQKIGLHYECQQGLPKAMGNPRLLRQAVLNLLANATQALEGSGGEIIIRLGESEDHYWVRLSVEDNGPGIPEEVRPTLFDELFTTKPNGTGLGLPITREIIEELHDGKIWYETTLGKGTIFTFEVPAIGREETQMAG